MSHQVDEVGIEGAAEPALLVVPATPSGAGIVFLHWFDEAPNANRTQFLEEARSLADEGVTSILPQLTFPWSTPPSGAAADVTLIEQESSVIAGAASVLVADTGVDRARIGMVGHDFGAMHGALWMARERAACGVLIAATPRWSDWFLPFWEVGGDRFDYMRSLGPLDPINAVREIQSPLLFQFGERDFYIAAMTGLELHRAAGGPALIETYDTGHDMEADAAIRDRHAFLTEHLLG